MPPTGYQFKPNVHKFTGSAAISRTITFHRRERVIGLLLTVESTPGTLDDIVVTRTPISAPALIQTIISQAAAASSFQHPTALNYQLVFEAGDILTVTYANTNTLDYLLEVITEPVE